MIHEPEDIEESPLKNLRELLGMTQQDFAQLMGVAVSTVSRWERGQSQPSFTAQQWRKLLGEMERINLGMANLPDDLSPGNHLILGKGG